MIGSHNNPSLRAISVIALVQTGVVVFGTLLVTVTLKLKGYKGGIVPDSFFNSSALFVRHWGVVFLLVPLFWSAVAVVASRTATQTWVLPLIISLGIAMVFCGLYYYAFLVQNPCIL